MRGHVLPLVYYLFIMAARFLALPSVYFYFLSVTISKPPDDVIISQLQAISELFSSYLPSGAFCQVSKLTIHEENGRKWEKCLFDQNWAKIPRIHTLRRLQG